MRSKDLLTIAGVDYRKLLPKENGYVPAISRDIEYLNKIFKNLGLRLSDRFNPEDLRDIQLYDWVNAFSNVYCGSDGSGPQGEFILEYIDPPIRGVVTQVNRLGLRTHGSCGGHADSYMRQVPWIEFNDQSDAYILHRLLKNPSTRRLYGTILTFFLSYEGLMDLSIELSEFEDLQEERTKFIEDRETRLKELLDINGESGNEGEIRQRVLCEVRQSRLTPKKIEVDDVGNILIDYSSLYLDRHLRYGKPTVLLSAHMDIKYPLVKGSVIEENEGILHRSEGVLGADDRAGIALILNVINEFGDFKDLCNVKVAFTVGEEDRLYGARAIKESFFKDVDYAISLDRGNCSDIVTHTTDCHYDHGNILKAIFESIQRDRCHAEGLDYQPCRGGSSDLYVWSQDYKIPSVNLSIGYHGQHSSQETLDLDCWLRTHKLLKLFLERIPSAHNRLQRDATSLAGDRGRSSLH